MWTQPFAEYGFLFIGLGIFLAISIAIVLPNILPTSRGRLSRQRRELRYRQYEFQRAEKAAGKAARTYAKLHTKSQQTKPNRLRKAKENADDLTTMLGHAKDKALVAENHVRRILLDEFSPAEHQKLLKRYLPND